MGRLFAGSCHGDLRDLLVQKINRRRFNAFAENLSVFEAAFSVNPPANNSNSGINFYASILSSSNCLPVSPLIQQYLSEKFAPANHPDSLKALFSNDFIDKISEDAIAITKWDNTGLQSPPLPYSKETEFLYLPFGIARLQKCLAEAILKGMLEFTAAEWNLLVLERDYAIAQIGIEDFKTNIAKLFLLEGSGRHIPKINLKIVDRKLLNSLPTEIGKAFPGHSFDLVIDLAVLPIKEIDDRRKSFSWPNVVVRSVDSTGSKASSKAVSPKISLFEHDFIPDESNTAIFKDWINSSLELDLSNEEQDVIFQSFNRTVHLYKAPENNKKLHVALISAFCQPGPKVVLVPDHKTENIYQSELIRLGISCQSYRNGDIANPNRFISLTADELQDSAARHNFLNELKGLSTTWIIPDIHAISDWSCHFSAAFNNVTCFIFSEILQQKLSNRLIAFSGLLNYEIERDILQSLGLSETTFTKISGKEIPTLQKVRSVRLKTLDPSSFEDEDNTAREWLLEKQSASIRMEYLRKAFSRQGRKETNNLLIFAPPLFDHLRFDNGQVGNHWYSQSTQQDDFYLPGFEGSYHLNAPLSLSELVRRIGLISVNGPAKSNHTILHSDHKASLNPDNRDFENTIDRKILLSQLQHSHKGPEKEKKIIKELMKEISFPSMLRSDNTLTKAIESSSGKSVFLEVERPHLTVFEESSGDMIAQIDLSSTEVAISFEKDGFETVAETVQQFVMENRGTSYSLIPWIKKYFKEPPIPGLLERLETGEEKNVKVDFTLSNDMEEKVEQILEYLFEGESIIYKIQIILKSGASMDISLDIPVFKQVVWKACQESIDTTGFIRRINELYKKEISRRDEAKGIFYKNYKTYIRLPHRQVAVWNIEELLLKIRNADDTKIALHRLKQFGVIEEYEVNDANARCSFLYKAKEDREIIEIFISKVKPFLSENELASLRDKILSRVDMGRTAIETVLEMGIDFIYQYPVQAKQRDLDKMLDLCQSEEINLIDQFVGWSEAWFAINDEMKVDLTDNTMTSQAVLWKYINKSETAEHHSYYGNLKHLEGSCIYLKSKGIESPVLDILTSFYTILLETGSENDTLVAGNEDRVLEATKKLTNGFIELKRIENIDTTMFMVILDKFMGAILKHRQAATEFVYQCKSMILLEVHNRWLKSFNLKFLVEHD
ncbi:MAG: hypothetical protein AAF502_25355 [Bacteroidota bacterium]